MESEAQKHNHTSTSINKPPPSSLDPRLSSVRLFWYLVWLCSAEAAFLLGLLLNATVVTHEVELEEEHGEKEIGFGNEGEQMPRLVSPGITALYFLPSCLVLAGSLLMFLSKRNDYFRRKLFLVIVSVALVGGIAGTAYALYLYIYTYDRFNCKEFEGWSVGVVRTLYVVLTLCPLGFRFGTILALSNDIKAFSNRGIPDSETDSKLSKELDEDLKPWKKAIEVCSVVIMCCCMPLCCKSSDEHEAHIFQHIMQFIYEIILFIVALVEHKYIELVAIVAGILGSVMGITKLYMVDSFLNMFALAAGVFLMGNTIAHYECIEGDVRYWLYLILFSLIASSIRFKSVLHTFVESREQIQLWLLAQVPWISSASELEGFFKVQNFLKLRTFEDTHKKSHAKKTGEKAALLPRKSNPHANDKRAVGILLGVLAGIGLVLTFVILFIVIFPQYKGGAHVDEIKSWQKSECKIQYYNAIYKESNYFFIYEVKVNLTTNTNNTALLTAIPLQLRYSTPNDLKGFVNSFSSSHYLASSMPCRIPESPLIYNYTTQIFNKGLDYNRKNAMWDGVVILGSDATLDHFKSMYNLWICLPTFMIALGLVIFGLSVYGWRKEALRVKTAMKS